MIRLSVNVNKVATLRNSRGGRVPSVLDAVDVCLAAGAPGITVHPRADRRHITPDDVREIARALRRHGAPASSSTSKAIRGPSCSIWSRRCGPISARSCRSCPARSPARPAGSPGRETDRLPDVVGGLQVARHSRQPVRRRRRPTPIRVGGIGRRRSRRAVHRAVRARVRARARRPARASFEHVRRRRRGWRTSLGLGVNAGHDLDLDNLDAVPRAAASSTRSRSATPSCRARCSSGLDTVVREYLDVLAAGDRTA